MNDAAPRVSLGKLFSVFALIGVTSFGGGIVAYLRRALVDKEKWLDVSWRRWKFRKLCPV